VITITFIVFLYSIMDILPLIFLKQAQNTVGEADLTYRAKAAENISQTSDQFMYNSDYYVLREEPPDTSSIFVNYTNIKEKTKDFNRINGVTPRWFAVADFTNPNTTDSLTTSGVVMVIDSKNEVEIGLGRDFTKELLGANQAFVLDSGLEYLGIKPNNQDEIRVTIDTRDFLSTIFDTSNPLTQADIEKLTQEAGLDLNSTQNVQVNVADFFNFTDAENALGIDLSPIQDFNFTVTPVDIYDIILDNQDALFVLNFDFQVIGSFDAPMGKFANSFGNAVVIDSNYLIEEVTEVVNTNLNSLNSSIPTVLSSTFTTVLNVTENLENLELNHYAMQVDAVFRNREDYYMSTPENNERMIINLQTDLNLDIPLESTAPVLGALEGLNFIRLFLQSTFMTIVFFMILLSVMLIYSLMIADVDEKTYEMGMLRALGLRRASLVQIIVIQSVIFSGIGIIAGMILSATLNSGLRWYIFNTSKNSTTYWLSVSAALSGIIIGALMPILSNIWAIKRALGKKIRDSLDVFHTGLNEVMIRIIKLENYGLSIFEITLGITLTLMGVITYYFLPASFLFNRLDLFFFILNMILVGMIIGLTFLCFLIFPYVQMGIIYVFTFVFSFDLKLRPLILKNLNHSHKKRNMKTAMLFTIALSFLVFSGSSLLLIGNLILGFIKNFVGGDIVISSFLSGNHLPEKDLRAFCDREMVKEKPLMEMYAFAGLELTEYFEEVFGQSFEFRLNSGGSFPDNEVNIIPVEENYIDSSLIDFYVPKHLHSGVNFQNSQGKPDVVKSLYSDEKTTEFGNDLDPYDTVSKNMSSASSSGTSSFAYDRTQQIKGVLPLGIKDVLSIKGGDTIKLALTQQNLQINSNYRYLVRGLPQKVPGFFFMSYKQVQFFLQSIISFPQAFEMAYFQSFLKDNKAPYDEYLNKADVKTWSYNYPKERLLVRLIKGVTDTERNVLVNQLSGLLTDDTMVVFNVAAFEKAVKSTTSLLQIFMILLGAIAFILSFFLLIISTTSNINENMWEFGVLRAIGLQKMQILRVYLYESIAVTLSA